MKTNSIRTKTFLEYMGKILSGDQKIKEFDLTVSEASRRFGVSVPAICNRIRRGRLGSLRIGRSVTLVKSTELRAYRNQ